MAIIYSYPLNQPKRDDLLIGTITYDEDAVNPVHGNPTVSFTIGSLLDLVSGQGNAQNLQQVTNIGNTTTNSIVVSNNLLVSGGYYDSSNQPGTAGQLLSSTATGTQWVNVAAQGVTSVGLSMPAAFTVANSPITQAGILSVTGAGTAAQYINGLGNLVTFPTIPTQYVLPVATTVALGGIKIGYTEAGKNYAVQLSSEKAFVNVPWTDTPYTLPVATSADLGGVKIGYTDNAKNYAVELDSDQMYVNVPWTDTPYVLPLAADGTRGGVQIGYTQTATRDYPVTLDSEKMLVTVPWTDTPPNPFQTITGTGTANASTGIILSDNGGTVLLNGTGSVTVTRDAATSGTIVINGTDTGITTVVVKASTISTGFGISEIINARELELYPHYYAGTTNVGFVPTGGSATTFLRGDGSWGAIPTGLQFQGTWDARNIAEGGASDGGDPNLDGIAGAVDGWLYIVSVAGSAVPNGAATTPNSWNIGDWCVFDGTNWTRVPSSTTGVTTFTSNFTSTGVGDPQYISGSTLTADTGGVDIGRVNLNATGTQDSTTFLRGDNTWDVPAYIPNTDTQNIYTNSWQQSTNDIILRKVLTGAGSGTQDIKIIKGANITFTYTDEDNFTIAASNTQENTTWYIRDSADADKTVNNLKYLKFATATGTLGTALTGAGSTADPYLMTLTSPDTNTQLGVATTTTLGGIELGSDTVLNTAFVTGNTGSTTRSYPVQLNAARQAAVYVPWTSGGTYSWTVKDQTTGSSAVVSADSIQFKSETGTLGTTLTEPSTGAFVMTLTSPNTMGSGFTVSADTNTAATTITQGDTLTIAGGTNVSTVSDPDGTITINATDTNTKYDLSSGTDTTLNLFENEIVATADVNGNFSNVSTINYDNESPASGIVNGQLVTGTGLLVGTRVVSHTTTTLTFNQAVNVPNNAPLSFKNVDTVAFTAGSNVTLTGTSNSIEIAADDDDTLYDLAGAASTTAGQYNLVLSADSTAQDTMVFKQGSDITFTRAANLLTITAANDNDTYTLTSTGKVITLNDVDAGSGVGTVTFVDGSDIAISSAADNTITITNEAPDTGLPAIIVDDTAGNMSFGNTNVTAATVRAQIGAGTGDGDVTASSTTTFTNKSGSNSQWANDEGYTTNTGTTTADNTQTFTNKSGSNSQWTNDEGYTTNTGTVTPSSTNTFTNKSGSNSQWTNDEGYTTNTGTTTASNTQTFTNKSGNISMWTNDSGYLTSYTDTNYYVTGASFNTGNGVLSITGNNAAVGATVDLDGRYVTSSGVTSVATGNGLSGGTITSTGTLTMSGSYSGTFSVIGAGWLTAEGNVANTNPPISYGVALGWNQSGGSAESNLWFRDNTTSHANNKLDISSYNGTSDERILRLHGNKLVDFNGNASAQGTTFLYNSGATSYLAANKYTLIGNHSNPTNTAATFYDQAGQGPTISGFAVCFRTGSTPAQTGKLDSGGTFTVSGDIVAYGSPSDVRLKENIQPIESALDKAMKLQGVTFNWKNKSEDILDIKEDIGFIAQDVQKVLPELVRENDNGMLSMRHQGITPILLEAIKELKAEIEELKCKSCNCK